MPGIWVQQSIPRIRSNSRRVLLTPITVTLRRPHTRSHIQITLTSEVLLPLSTVTA